MFWKKHKKQSSVKGEKKSYPYRFCELYVSEKHKQILFVPYGKTEYGIYAELDNLIIDSWPCKFKDLESNIRETLNRYSERANKQHGNWPSYENSKAKSQKSFESDYINLRLETDISRDYGEGEVERIKVTARPTSLDNTFELTGTGHLIETKVAQIILDIFEACMKIRNN